MFFLMSDLLTNSAAMAAISTSSRMSWCVLHTATAFSRLCDMVLLSHVFKRCSELKLRSAEQLDAGQTSNKIMSSFTCGNRSCTSGGISWKRCTIPLTQLQAWLCLNMPSSTASALASNSGYAEMVSSFSTPVKRISSRFLYFCSPTVFSLNLSDSCVMALSIS